MQHMLPETHATQPFRFNSRPPFLLPSSLCRNSSPFLGSQRKPLQERFSGLTHAMLQQPAGDENKGTPLVSALNAFLIFHPKQHQLLYISLVYIDEKSATYC
jgi:hypothetical protein